MLLHFVELLNLVPLSLALLAPVVLLSAMLLGTVVLLSVKVLVSKVLLSAVLLVNRRSADARLVAQCRAGGTRRAVPVVQRIGGRPDRGAAPVVLLDARCWNLPCWSAWWYWNPSCRLAFPL